MTGSILSAELEVKVSTGIELQIDATASLGKEVYPPSRQEGFPEDLKKNLFE